MRAALLLEDAARLTPLAAAEARRSRTIVAAEHHYASGNAARARDLLERLIPELPRGPTRARALALLATTRADDWASAEALLQEALIDAGDNHRMRAWIEIHLSGNDSSRGKFSAMLDHADSAIASAELAGDSGLLAKALAMRAQALFFNGLAVDPDALRRAVELVDAPVTTTYDSPTATVALILFQSDDYERARPALERLIQQAQDRGEEYDVGGLTFYLAILEWHAGNRADGRASPGNGGADGQRPGRGLARPVAGLGEGAVHRRARRARGSAGACPAGDGDGRGHRGHIDRHASDGRARDGRAVDRPPGTGARTPATGARVISGRGLRPDRFDVARPVELRHRGVDRVRASG